MSVAAFPATRQQNNSSLSHSSTIREPLNRFFESSRGGWLFASLGIRDPAMAAARRLFTAIQCNTGARTWICASHRANARGIARRPLPHLLCLSSGYKYGQLSRCFCPFLRRSLQRAKREACNWLRSSSITSEYFIDPTIAFANNLVQADSVLKCGQEDSLEPADQDSEKAARSTTGFGDVLYWGQSKRVRCPPRTGSESNDGEKPLGRFERGVLDCGHGGQGMGRATSRPWGTGE
ncbi:hypothetical protein V1525DRAFT_407710 [Lipomyces kononenkoae]|uniref:Uncharacterized protein n=1 Tax=Lipomyces kononenkoae TaxID=34357 RepID=A0ACC3SWZ5_LIPKO